MKKLFISVPMKGRTRDDIFKSIGKMHKIAEAVFDQELELIHTYIEDTPDIGDANLRIYLLGESIKRLSKADYFIGIKDTWRYPGCSIEWHVATEYGIPTFTIESELAMDDYQPDNMIGHAEAKC